MAKKFSDKRLPKKVNALGTEYKVKRSKEIFLDGEPCDGLCHTDNKIIETDSDLVGQKKWKVFFHEMFHAVLHEGSSDLGLSEHQEDNIVDILGNFVIKFLDKEV